MRTQVYLDAGEAELLTEASLRTGASRSELIRRAVRAQYGKGAPLERVAALRASAGIWADRPETGREYVERIRSDLDERMEQAGLS